MEKINKIFLMALLLFVSVVNGKCQDTENSQAIEIRAGRSLTPGDYVSIRYESYSNIFINLSAKVYMERSKKNGFDYSAYGLDIMTEYYTKLGQNTNHLFELKAGLGATWHLENEPWIYKGWSSSRKMNYGFAGEMVGEWAVAEEFSLTVFAQQKYLFNKALGCTRFAFGIGIKCKIGE